MAQVREEVRIKYPDESLKIATKRPAKQSHRKAMLCRVSVSFKHAKIMAKLSELCPQLREIAAGGRRERPKRRASNYALVLAELERLGSEGLFSACKGERTAKKTRNTLSSEQAGRLHMRVAQLKAGVYVKVTCRIKN